ncbi:MAG TPA: HAMP domain-containing sensor histidine kinase [Pseudolabrys sp.]|nr:HAMP domain-containing sensor histidine kinase [Pseudolabrys sp.]
MQHRLGNLPVTVRLPLFAAVMIFVAAVASTQAAIFFMGRQSDRQIETLGQVYLDGLSAALLPYAAGKDAAGIKAALDRALSFHDGVVDRRLAFITADGAAVDAVREGISSDQTIPIDKRSLPDGFLRANDGTIWIWRQLGTNPPLGTVVANLDTSPFDAARWQLRWLLVAFDLLFSGACAVVGFFLVRRIQQPVTTVARHLYDAALGVLKPIPKGAIPAGDLPAERMILAFNAMAHATGERESLLAHMAEQQRQADLGRLTATIAHEIRNPLGGMRTAVSTLRRFGDKHEARQESVDFLDRGIATLENVVNATLENFRTRPEWRPLSRLDFDDLRLLVDADARSRDVALRIELDIPDIVPVAALDVRQALLNLLLNAVRASAKGTEVVLAARIEDEELLLSVRDQGAGMAPAMVRAMEDGAAASSGTGLGVSVVIRLVEQLQGRIAIESDPAAGTAITLHFPLQPTERG